MSSTASAQQEGWAWALLFSLLLRLVGFHGHRIGFGKLGQLLPLCFGEKRGLKTDEANRLDGDAITATEGRKANPNFFPLRMPLLRFRRTWFSLLDPVGQSGLFLPTRPTHGGLLIGGGFRCVCDC